MSQRIYQSQVLQEKYTEIRHSSGLKILVFPKNRTTVSVALTVPFGSGTIGYVDEGGQEKILPLGSAHYLEHKMFTCPDGADALQKFSTMGMDANAYTSYYRTAYLFNTTQKYLRGVEMLLDCILHPYFTQESVNSERGIIREEIHMYDDSPSEVCYQQLLSTMYQVHPIRNNICGTDQSIVEITPEWLYEIYKRFYRVSDMTLILCGKVRVGDVLRVCDRVLAGHVDGPAPKVVTYEEPAKVGQTKVECRKQTALPQFVIGIKDVCVPNNTADKIRRDAIMTILDDMLFSRSGSFYNDLLDCHLLTPTYSYSYSLERDIAMNTICGESVDPQQVMEHYRDYLQQQKNKGLSRESFERNRKMLIADFYKCFDSTEEIVGELSSFADDQFDLFDYPDLIQNICFEEIQDAFKKMFQEEYTVLSVVWPLDSEDEED